MSAKFDFDGKVKTLQVGTLNPSMIARLFRLDENSIVLSDEDGYCYMPNGDKFEPTLKPDKSYTVDGIETVAVKSSPETQLSLKKMNDDLQVIQGSQQLSLIQDVIVSCKDMNESANMLYHGPQAAVLVQSIAILSVCAPDPSLDIQSLAPDVKGRLADPGSFRASLLHVANQMCNAFRQADYAMKKIRACLIDLPDYFDATLEVVGQNEDEKAKKILFRTTQHIKDLSDTCKNMAEKTNKTFSDVLKDIDALAVAATSSKTVNEREKIELKKLKDEMEIKEKEKKAQEEQLKQEYEEANMKAKEALREYREQMKNSTGLGKLFLATLTDGVLDVIKTGAQILPHNLIKNAANAMNPFGQENVKCSNSMKYAVETALIQCLDKIGTALSDPTSLNDETISDYIASLNDFQKYSAATTEGIALFNQAKKVENFFKQNKNSLKNGDDKMKKEISSIKISVQNTVNTICLAQQQQSSQAAATNSLREQMLRADTERVNAAQTQFNAADLKAEARRKELNENRKELIEIICKLKSINTNTVELTEIIQYLRFGIDYLGKVKKNWESLVEFFSNIQIIVDENLTKNVNTFITEAKDPVSRTLMLQAALKATGYCIQVSDVAHIYSAVSGKYIMPIISSIGEQLALEPSKARQKQHLMESTLTDMEHGVTDLIKEKQVEAQARFHSQMEKYGRNMVKSVKVGSIASTKAIKH
uniref:Uncharacterized protein n=1 Tax=Panagrolaimus davidi TaxID=227884 RepID=A0A914PKR4_9BILA